MFSQDQPRHVLSASTGGEKEMQNLEAHSETAMKGAWGPCTGKHAVCILWPYRTLIPWGTGQRSSKYAANMRIQLSSVSVLTWKYFAKTNFDPFCSLANAERYYQWPSKAALYQLRPSCLVSVSHGDILSKYFQVTVTHTDLQTEAILFSLLLPSTPKAEEGELSFTLLFLIVCAHTVSKALYSFVTSLAIPLTLLHLHGHYSNPGLSLHLTPTFWVSFLNEYQIMSSFLFKCSNARVIKCLSFLLHAGLPDSSYMAVSTVGHVEI